MSSDCTNDAAPADLPWTGERLVPSHEDCVALEHLHRYALADRLVAGRAVLDVACGEGYGSALLARSAARVVGVDLCPETVRHAAAKYRRDNLSFLAGSCTSLPLPAASVDVVVSFETIEHIDQHDAMLAEVRRVLRPGGVLLISTPDRDVYTDPSGDRNPYHVRELSRPEFETLLGGHFRHWAIYGQRLCVGSVVVPTAPGARAEYTSVRGNYTTVQPEPGLHRAVFLIAVASDAGLPELPAGLFEGLPPLRTWQDHLFSYHQRTAQLRHLAGLVQQLEAELTAVYSSRGVQFLRAASAAKSRVAGWLRKSA